MSEKGKCPTFDLCDKNANINFTFLSMPRHAKGTKNS